jgi:hypothetical protein
VRGEVAPLPHPVPRDTLSGPLRMAAEGFRPRSLWSTIPPVGERQDANNVGWGRERVTIRQAATLLGVHPNTVRNRVKAGIYPAEKVSTERGETWMLDPNSLTTNTPTNASQQLVSGTSHVGPQAIELVQELLRPFVKELGEVRQELGNQQTRRQMAEMRILDLEAELAAKEAELAALRGPEPPQMHTVGEGGGTTPPERETPSERPWWRRIWEW